MSDTQPTGAVKTGQKRADIVTAIVLLAFAAFVILNAIPMKIFTKYMPGPGLFPLMLGIIIALLSCVMLISALNPAKEDKKSPFADKKALVPSLKLVVGLIAYAALLSPLGYIVDTFLLVLYIMLVVSKEKPKTSILTAVCITVMIVLIFQIALQLRLPKGIFGF